LLSCVNYVVIYGCKNVTVVVGAGAKIVRVLHCEGIKVIAPCRSIHVRECTSCTFHLCTNSNPLLVGNNTNLVFAPYNTHYPMLEAHMAQAGIDAANNMWDDVFNLQDPLPLSSSFSGINQYLERPEPFSLMPPAEFSQFNIPFDLAGSTKTIPCRLPDDYATELNAKKKAVGGLQDLIKLAKLDTKTKAEFQNVVQAKFREWLVSSNNIREVRQLMACTKDKGDGSGSESEKVGGGSSGAGAATLDPPSPTPARKEHKEHRTDKGKEKEKEKEKEKGKDKAKTSKRAA